MNGQLIVKVKRRMHTVSCYSPTKAKFKSQLHFQFQHIIQPSFMFCWQYILV